jgi:two-component system chemotaxis response regulator CheB
MHGEDLHVLVVDDSAMVRQVMQAILSTNSRVKVNVAADPLIAWVKMQKEPPDVVITDLEMPRMLEEGAVEVITKPKVGVREFLHESAVTLVDAVWSASQAQVRPRPRMPAVPRLTADEVLPRKPKVRAAGAPNGLIAVGASTGGTEALRVFLTAMPTDCPAIAIVQHMPEVFTRAFADRLNKECAIEVEEARDGDRLQPGLALIAPGNRHMLVNRAAENLVVQVIEGPLVSRHRPSVDVLFRSVAASAGSKAVGIIMTGMGDDGAQGLHEMKEAGAATIAQDEASCIVFGMPKEAISRGAVSFVVPLDQIAGTALNLPSKRAGWKEELQKR